MIAALLLLAAVQGNPVDAERDFAAMAQTRGQWTAFRAYAAPEGVMFVPQAVNAQEWLKDRKDPPVPVMWWPGQSWISCDGSVAVNTGPWVRAGGKSVGYFTTVWARQSDGSWKWLLDHGDALPRPRRALDKVETRRASCPYRPARKPRPEHFRTGNSGGGSSADDTIRWGWRVAANGARILTVHLLVGSRLEAVLKDEVAGQ